MDYIANAISRFPTLCVCEDEMRTTVHTIAAMHRSGKKMLLCGNGGSDSSTQHIAGELLNGFISYRPLDDNTKAKLSEDLAESLQQGIAAIPLNSFHSAISAFGNNVNPDLSYAQMTLALGRYGDVFLGISTSGNALNVCCAAEVAKAQGLTTIALTGEKGGNLAKTCDIAIKVPEVQTYLVQELHLVVFHAICAAVEQELFD